MHFVLRARRWRCFPSNALRLQFVMVRWVLFLNTAWKSENLKHKFVLIPKIVEWGRSCFHFYDAFFSKTDLKVFIEIQLTCNIMFQVYNLMIQCMYELQNNHHTMSLTFITTHSCKFLVMRSFKTSYQLLNTGYSSVNSSHQDVHYIPRTYLYTRSLYFWPQL